MTLAAPRTWVSGEVVTAAMMNTEIRDAFAAWTSYGSGAAWTGAAGNPSLGNGTWAGAYVQVGKFVTPRVVITMGSTTSYGSGQWRIALPVTPKAGVRWAFQAEALDSGVNQYTCRGVWDAASSTVLLFRVGGGAAADSAITSAAPHAWGTGDVLTLSGSTYEAA
jgi:hypothetical protein